jgi:hypothetical protein
VTRGVYAVAAAIALLLFAYLAQRHVGGSYFLADQVDQLEKYEALLHLEPEGLWGGVMSGTTARALGPMGAVTFGLPISLGLGINAIHRLTSLLLAIATALAFWQLSRVDLVLGSAWLIVFTSMPVVWWDAGMFWVNTLLLPFGLIVLALFAAHVRRPTWAKAGAIALVLLLALQVNLVALAGLPLLLMACCASLAGVSTPDARHANLVTPANARATIGTSTAIAALFALALLPYTIAELKTGFRNTRAMFAHADTAVHATGDQGLRSARDSLVQATDALGIMTGHPTAAVVTSSLLAAAAIALLAVRRRHRDVTMVNAATWLVVTSVIAVVGQALFFLMMARPLNGLHYTMLLAPWYAIPVAALTSAILASSDPRRSQVAAAGLALGAVVLLVLRGPALADRYAERTAWNYRAIVSALDASCRGQAVQTLEGPGLLNELTPGSDSVLQYLLNRGHTRCRYDAEADVLIAADRGGSFADNVEVRGRRFIRESVHPPGLARYRRAESTLELETARP